MSKTAVLTGITSGIGQAIKTRLEAEGWQVFGISRHLPADQPGYEADLSLLDSVEPLASRIVQDCPQVDAFIHVAGVWHDGKHPLRGLKLHEFSATQIVQTMNVGLTSAMILASKILHVMPDQGTMLFISGLFQDGGANWLPYYTSKRALEDFAVGLAADEPRVRVYGVSPAPTATESHRRFYPDTVQAAQAPLSVAKICTDLISGTLPASSGTVVEVRDGKPGMGYHG